MEKLGEVLPTINEPEGQKTVMSGVVTAELRKVLGLAQKKFSNSISEKDKRIRDLEVLRAILIFKFWCGPILTSSEALVATLTVPLEARRMGDELIFSVRPKKPAETLDHSHITICALGSILSVVKSFLPSVGCLDISHARNGSRTK